MIWKANVVFVLSLFCLSFVNANFWRKSSGKTSGDNGYELVIEDNPNGYIPGKTYNIFIHNTNKKPQSFRNFTITAGIQGSNPINVGKFLTTDSLAVVAEPNVISATNTSPKTEIQVKWIAPYFGADCVNLSAEVCEESGKCFSGEGRLFHVICEQELENQDQEECCACSFATYSLTFEGLWSKRTHPKDFPPSKTGYFSNIIGVIHDKNFTFFGDNHVASDGFKTFAEEGSVNDLEEELRTRGSRINSLVKVPGLRDRKLNSKTSSTFRIAPADHKISVVSKFGPSPDWFVGVRGVNLCTSDCHWKESLTLDLELWDAGTDSGITYNSANSEIIPRERMRKITTTFPEDATAPFFNPGNGEIPPLARIHIKRKKEVDFQCYPPRT